MDVYEYEMLLRLSTIKAERGTLKPDAERILGTCLAMWDEYVTNAIALIKRGLDRRPRLRMPYIGAMPMIQRDGYIGPESYDTLDYEEFIRDDLCGSDGNYDEFSLRLAATRFCKKQIERQMKGR